jgi:ATP-dependent Lon protease
MNIFPKNGKKELPLVPLRELVVFPHNSTAVFLGRKNTIEAVNTAMKQDKMIFLVPQREAELDPKESDLYAFGTAAKISQLLRLPDGTLRLLVDGLYRCKVIKHLKKNDVEYVLVQEIFEDRELSTEASALMNTLSNSFKRYATIQKKIPKELYAKIEQAEYPDKLIDIIFGAVPMKGQIKIPLLESSDTLTRLELAAITLESEIEIFSLQKSIHQKVKKRMEKSQRDYYLNEQLKEINKELGKDKDDPNGTQELKKRIEELEVDSEVQTKALKELGRLEKLQSMSPESGVLRTYLDWLLELPWKNSSEDSNDLKAARTILDQDHFNMKKPKTRIIEYLAVRKLQKEVKGPILCFVGPPGTGKTSLAKSVARAMQREFVRFSLGGLRDEAEIRGHRKTYVGALPGKIIQSIKKAGTRNPVFLLDEIDKISSDFRGDPSSALLEALDPEQNSNFMDHYLEIPFDLSQVFFIATANSMHGIPYPLLDRMEIIEVPGYTEHEKYRIATDYIIPKQLKENGLDWADINFEQKSIYKIIDAYTMESGVRELERQIAAVLRKIAVQTVETESMDKENYSIKVTAKSIAKYLGTEHYSGDLYYKDAIPGLANGLAWTEVGGTMLPVEIAILEGMGELILTGSLGDVMKESARTALSFLRANNRKFGLEPDFQKDIDIHIHVPEGAIPKDGPSAGITITSALFSALRGVTMNPGFAMTGEITLTGRIVGIGGVKEKILAAHRNKMKHVFLPKDNKKDLEEIPEDIRKQLQFHFADNAADALHILFPESAFPNR